MRRKGDANLRYLVGFTGRKQSAIAAYLLKKQGHHVAGVGCFLFGNELQKEIFAPWDLGDPEAVKNVCEELEIPFYAVDLQQEFKAQVEEFVVSGRLDGRVYPIAMMINRLIINTLIEKAERLNCDKIATGHFVKMTNLKGVINLISANDLEVDQSHLFSLVNFQDLEKMEFPLAEVRSKQVDDIAEIIKVGLLEGKKTVPPEEHPKFQEFLDQRIPESLIREGTMYRWESGTTIGDHKGLIFHNLGESNLSARYPSVTESELMIVKVDPMSANFYLEKPDVLIRNVLILDQCQFMPHVDLSVPFAAFARCSNHLDEKQKVRIRPRSLNRVEVLFDQEIQGLFPRGDVVTIYSRAGIGGTILGSGFISMAGHYDEDGEFLELPKPEEDEFDLDEKDILKKELNKGFQF